MGNKVQFLVIFEPSAVLLGLIRHRKTFPSFVASLDVTAPALRASPWALLGVKPAFALRRAPCLALC